VSERSVAHMKWSVTPCYRTAREAWKRKHSSGVLDNPCGQLQAMPCNALEGNRQLSTVTMQDTT
jgi:hypothetical protein